MEDYRNKVSNYMQLYPRILVNVLVILVNILVNLLVKLAKLRVRGAMGLRGVHLGEARTISNSIIVSRPADSPPGGPLHVEDHNHQTTPHQTQKQH